jgi:hypothetical protein
MNNEELEEYEKALFSTISHQTQRIIEQEPIEQLRLILKDLQRRQSLDRIEQLERREKLSLKEQKRRSLKDSSLEPIIKLLDKLIQDLIAEAKRTKGEKVYWKDVEFKILNAVSSQIQVSFSHYLKYCFLQGFLTGKYNRVLNDNYRKQLRKDFGLETNGKLQKALMPLLEPLFRDEVKRGGSISDKDEKQKLQFLALYNRYIIVIGRVRNEKKSLKKQKKSDITAKREAMAKYKIPESLIMSTFSDDSPGNVALDWAISEMKFKPKRKVETNREYLKKLLNEIRKEYGGRAYIVDVDFSIGKRIYAVHPRNNERHLEQLRYTPLEKTNEIIMDDPDSLLIEWNY